MAEEQPSLHIDTDWKKQAQEEKRRLTEEEQKRAVEREKAATMPTGMASGPAVSPASTAGTARSRVGSTASGASSRERALPEASFPTLVNSLVTQVLLYLGELTPRGVEPQVNLDMAKFNVDLLGILEAKAKGNLTPDEQKLLDNALYEVRMRYVNVASAYATV
jgi:hypothetical protein